MSFANARMLSHRSVKSLIVVISTLLLAPCFGLEISDADLPESLEAQYRAALNVQTTLQASRQSADPQEASSPAIVAGSFTTLIQRIPKNWYPRPTHSRLQLIHDLLMPLGIVNENLILPALSDFWLDDPESHTLFIHLHPDARWSNGIPVTTDDVVYTLSNLSELRPSSWRSDTGETGYLTGITRFDKSYFALHYSQKLDFAPTALFNLRPLPAHEINPSRHDNLAVSGPYRIDSFTNDQVTLLRVHDWWGNNIDHFKDRFMIRQIIMKPAGTEQFKAFKQGQVDCIASVSRTTATTPWLNELLETKKITHIVSTMKRPLSVWLISPMIQSEHQFLELHKQLKAFAFGETSNSPDVDLIFNAGSSFEWAKHAGYSSLSQSDLTSRIRTGLYDVAAVVLPGGMSTSEARNVIQTMSFEKRPLSIAALYDIPYYHYACWPWVTLPESSNTGGDILSPINLSDGGHIGIDRRQRARTLGSPNPSQDEQPTTVYYPTPQIRTK